MAYNSQDYDIFIGIDVDQKSFSFTVKDHEQMNRSHRIPADPENLYRHIENTYNGKRVICAYETGGSGYYLHDYLTSATRQRLDLLLADLEYARNQQLKVINELRAIALNNPCLTANVHCLRSIPGIGLLRQ
ncbi:MAG: hypothetical protein PHG87_05350 [Candidatus Omnitrophica bacterium]|nr:hypothetical protein [Candidatus Omnitrophota bacterium]